MNCLLNAQKNDIQVEIILYDDLINKKEVFESLFSAGAVIYLSKKMMHNKFCVLDNEILINGSYNWTNRAKSNDENIQITNGDLQLAQSFSTQFNKLKANCSKIDRYFSSKEELFEIFHQANIYNNYPYFRKIVQRNGWMRSGQKEQYFNGIQDEITRYFLILDKFYEKHVLKYEFEFERPFLENNRLNYDKAFKIYTDTNLSEKLFEADYNFNGNETIIPFSGMYETVSRAQYGVTSHESQIKRNIFKIDKSGNIVGEIFQVYEDNIFKNGSFLYQNKYYDRSLNIIKNFNCDFSIKEDFGILLVKKSDVNDEKIYGLADTNGNIIEQILYSKIYESIDNSKVYKKEVFPIFFVVDNIVVRAYWANRLKNFWKDKNKKVQKIYSLNSFQNALIFYQAFPKKNISHLIFENLKERFLKEWISLDVENLNQRLNSEINKL